MSLRSSPVASTLAPAVGLAALVFLGLRHWTGAPVVVAYWVAINLVAYPVWWVDKRQAKRGGFRVPEWTLHLLSLAGGGVGGVLAMRTLRHKTRKRVFRFGQPLLAAAGVAALGWALMGR